MSKPTPVYGVGRRVRANFLTGYVLEKIWGPERRWRECWYYLIQPLVKIRGDTKRLPPHICREDELYRGYETRSAHGDE